MLKKLLFALCLMSSLTTFAAESITGKWRVHDLFFVNSSHIPVVADMGKRVYFLVNECLYFYDVSSSTLSSFNEVGGLNDVGISDIFYDDDANLLFVAYVNSNIDIIDGKGKIYNVSNIKDMNMPATTVTFDDNDDVTGYTTKAINDITFREGQAFVATEYGYAVIDEDTKKMTANTNFGVKTNSVVRLGDYLLLFSNKYCYKADANTRYSKLSAITSKWSGSFSGVKTTRVDDETAFLLGSAALMRFTPSSSKLTTDTIVPYKVNFVRHSPSAWLASCYAQKCYYTIDASGTATAVSDLGQETVSSYLGGDGTIWAVGTSGLHKSGVSTYYKPNAIGMVFPYYVKYNTYNNKLYVGSTGRNSRITSSNYALRNHTYDGTTWTAYFPYKSGTTAYGSGYDMIFCPQDSNTYFQCTWDLNLLKITGKTRKWTVSSSNSYLTKYKSSQAFDNYGNLWVVQTYGNESNPVSALASSYVTGSSVKKAYWTTFSELTEVHQGKFQRASFIISRKCNMKIYTDGDYNSTSGALCFWDSGSEDLTATNTLKMYHSVPETTGTTISWQYLNCLVEDNNGVVWVGHTAGLFSLDPSTALTNDFAVTRPHVIDSDGNDTGILLDGYDIFTIAVDAKNRKWIGTTSSGIFVTNADGTEILANFTAENSGLPNNLVYNICCDNENNRVFCTTAQGLAEFDLDVVETANDLSNVYAYPNPVEPDFTGMVKITNVPVGCYLTITNAEGAVVKSFDACTTGNVLWDPCDENGSRLSTGTYKVYASFAGAGTTDTQVTQIYVIR